MSKQEPTESYKPGGKLRECDICGFIWREDELFQNEKGLWICPDDIDKPSVKDNEKEEDHPYVS